MKINNPVREALKAEGHMPTLGIVHLLDEPKKAAGVDFSQWQQDVLAVLAVRQLDFAELGATSHSIVRIGRDGMRAATGGLLPECYTGLPRLTWSMGQLLDGNQSNDMKRAALEACIALQKPGKHTMPKAGHNARARWSEALTTVPSLLETLNSPNDNDAVTYHGARKKFRLIVHTSIVQALIHEETSSR